MHGIRGFTEFEGFCTDRFRPGTQSFKSAMFTNFITRAGRTRFYHWCGTEASATRFAIACRPFRRGPSNRAVKTTKKSTYDYALAFHNTTALRKQSAYGNA